MNWDVCVEQLAAELSAEQLNTWIKPLQVEERAQTIYLFAPNRFVKDWVADRYLERIQSFYSHHVGGSFHVSVCVGSADMIRSRGITSLRMVRKFNKRQRDTTRCSAGSKAAIVEGSIHSNHLNLIFGLIILLKEIQSVSKGRCTTCVKKNGSEYNPLFLYGDTDEENASEAC